MGDAILREWLVNVGQRDAYERIATQFEPASLHLDRTRPDADR